MKKFFIAFISVCLLALVIGCQKTENKGNAAGENQKEYILVYENEFDFSGLSLVSEYKGKIISSSDDVASLYVDAGYDDENNLMKNDMNRWLLVVTDGKTGERYFLFDEKVQLGDINFQLADFFNDGKATTKIILYKNSSAELLIKAFSYEEGKGFSSETLYNSSQYTDGGINLRFSTISNAQ